MTNEEFKSKKLIVAPSILAADFANLEKSCAKVLKVGDDCLHIDIMDGQFVNNISFGPFIVELLRNKFPNTYLDVHLMIKNADNFIEKFANCINGKNNTNRGGISIHAEKNAEINPVKLLKEIKKFGLVRGLVINPSTQFEEVENLLEQIDLLLIMTVVPGFGGQKFMTNCLAKIEKANKYKQKNGLNYQIQVDGGLDLETAPLAIKAGANIIVAGTSIFKSDNISETIKKMKLNY